MNAASQKVPSFSHSSLHVAKMLDFDFEFSFNVNMVYSPQVPKIILLCSSQHRRAGWGFINYDKAKQANKNKKPTAQKKGKQPESLQRK